MESEIRRKYVPFNLRRWIDEHRHLLKPPVGNRQIWEDREFMVTVVGGPNARNDFHVDEGEELFYQLEGDITLRIREGGETIDVPIREGDIFLLPARVPHSPQRPANTVGLVVERKRTSGEKDGFLWFCDSCGGKLHEEFLHVDSIVSDLPPVFDRVFGDPKSSTCPHCGWRMERPR